MAGDNKVPPVIQFDGKLSLPEIAFWQHSISLMEIMTVIASELQEWSPNYINGWSFHTIMVLFRWTALDVTRIYAAFQFNHMLGNILKREEK